jgi:pimeloyl-ACP methyl ester carboxylesterase
MRLLFLILIPLLFADLSFSQIGAVAAGTTVVRVASKDGTRIAVECMGSGPSLLIVHGGSGDRKRWKPLLPLFASRFNVCAMDRRGHGESIDSSAYSLRKEFEDVAAVVNSLPGPVSVLGHSYGGVCALEASLITKKIARLILYEPPLQDLDHSAIAARIEKMIQAGKREEALVTFLSEVVMISHAEIDEMKKRPSWSERVPGIDIQVREMQALSKYRFVPGKFRRLKIPTLLLTGTETASPQLKTAIRTLMDTLPDRTLVELKGQGHNAMDAVPQLFVDEVINVLSRPDGGL